MHLDTLLNTGAKKVGFQILVFFLDLRSTKTILSQLTYSSLIIRSDDMVSKSA